MNFREFKDKYFEGDEEKAMTQLVREDVYENYELSGNKKAHKKLVHTIESDIAERYVNILISELDKNPEIVKGVVSVSHSLQKLNMEPEEIVHTKNPFVKKFWIRLLIILLFLLVPIALTCFKKIYGFDGIIYRSAITFSILMGGSYGVLPAIDALIKIFTFKKVKQELQKYPEVTENAEQEQLEEDMIPVAESCEKSDTALQELTLNQCKENLKKVTRGIKNLYIMFLILSVLIFIIIPLSLPILLVVIHLYNKANKSLKQVEKLNFIIRVLPCTGKEYSRKNAEVQRKKIHFSNGESFQFECGTAASIPIGMAEARLYESIEKGDLCYLLSTENETKIRGIYPCKEYKLSEKEFIKKGDCFVPAIHSETI